MSFSYKRIKLFVWLNGVISRLFYPFVKIIDHRTTKDSDKVVINAPQEININLSRLHFTGRAYWTNFSTFRSKEFFYVSVPGASIISKGMVLDKKNRVLLESTVFQKEYLNILNSNHLIFLKKFLPKRKEKKVISLLNKLDNNYYHWAMESLARILLIYREPFFTDYKIVVKHDARHFIEPSLKFLFNIPDERILTKTLGQHLEVEEALVVSFPHIRGPETQWTNVYVPEVIRGINKLAHERISELGIGHKKFPKRILISRKDAILRRLENEEEVLAALSEWDFVPVMLEDFSFEEQVALFAGAEIIIGIHGAGITNILYSKNPVLIEIFPEERNIRDAFYFVQITAALGIEHHLRTVKSENKKEDIILKDDVIKEMKSIVERALN